MNVIEMVINYIQLCWRTIFSSFFFFCLIFFFFRLKKLLTSHGCSAISIKYQFSRSIVVVVFQGGHSFNFKLRIKGNVNNNYYGDEEGNENKIDRFMAITGGIFNFFPSKLNRSIIVRIFFVDNISKVFLVSIFNNPL